MTSSFDFGKLKPRAPASGHVRVACATIRSLIAACLAPRPTPVLDPTEAAIRAVGDRVRKELTAKGIINER